MSSHHPHHQRRSHHPQQRSGSYEASMDSQGVDVSLSDPSVSPAEAKRLARQYGRVTELVESLTNGQYLEITRGQGEDTLTFRNAAECDYKDLKVAIENQTHFQMANMQFIAESGILNVFLVNNTFRWGKWICKQGLRFLITTALVGVTAYFAYQRTSM